MKAELKVKYGLIPKGSKFTVWNIEKKFVTLIIEGQKVDFGFSEIKFYLKNDSDYRQLGRFLLFAFGQKTDGLVMRSKDIDKVVDRIPYTKTITRKAISDSIYDFG